MKQKKALVAGTFDNFHLGHQHLLWQIANLAHSFVVIIARDKTVQKIKKRLPENNEIQRKKRIQLEKFSNGSVQLGRTDADFYQAIVDVNPEILFLGYDQQFDEKKCQEIFPDLLIVRLKPFHPEVFKSSKFSKRLL